MLRPTFHCNASRFIAIGWRYGSEMNEVAIPLEPAIHFTDFRTREGKSYRNLWKSAKWPVVVGIQSGLKSELKHWSLKSRFRGTLKEASEKEQCLA
ncbi:hypothetical protein AVEN_220413-1 [Araneus ventricosus]|uniref:Uncharacterized protein n=1 Tax=Araneus ventricosus TaxID=182803 RepID=A0A4Y2LLV5_ARAVE|nr:hypothetical protein AVEN_213962-1 [Araneus ventricosus]GBN15419.1 hypothetical protein AVEN_220413-1 [Araneus ventricosus]